MSVPRDQEPAVGLIQAWDGIVVLSALSFAVVLPLHLVLGSSTGPIRLGASIVFVIDLIVRLARERRPLPHGAEAHLPRQGWQRWAWVAVDAIAAIPAGALTGVATWDLVRLVKLLRTGGIMREWRLRELRRADEMQLGFVLVWLALAAHWIACGWLALRGTGAGTAGAAWVDAIYWTITTLATVGYGDIVPQTAGQKLYAIGTMILGLAFFGTLIGILATSWARRDPARLRFRGSVERLATAAKYAHLPRSLQRRIYDYHTYVWKQRLGYDEREFLEDLPRDLRAEALLHLRRNLVVSSPLFRDTDPAFLKEIAEHLRPTVLTPGDVVTRAGEPGDEMFFVVRGHVEVRAPDGSMLKRLGPGDFFGEIALVNRVPRTATVVATGYCDVYALSRTAFEHAVQHHPGLFAEIEGAAKARAAGQVE